MKYFQSALFWLIVGSHSNIIILIDEVGDSNTSQNVDDGKYFWMLPAYKLGIDTVQVESNRQFGAEIIMTSRQSMEAPHLNGSGGGPGLSPTCIRGLRAGWNASRPCHCDLDVPTLTCLL